MFCSNLKSNSKIKIRGSNISTNSVDSHDEIIKQLEILLGINDYKNYKILSRVTMGNKYKGLLIGDEIFITLYEGKCKICCRNIGNHCFQNFDYNKEVKKSADSRFLTTLSKIINESKNKTLMPFELLRCAYNELTVNGDPTSKFIYSNSLNKQSSYFADFIEYINLNLDKDLAVRNKTTNNTNMQDETENNETKNNEIIQCIEDGYLSLNIGNILKVTPHYNNQYYIKLLNNTEEKNDYNNYIIQATQEEVKYFNDFIKDIVSCDTVYKSKPITHEVLYDILSKNSTYNKFSKDWTPFLKDICKLANKPKIKQEYEEEEEWKRVREEILGLLQIDKNNDKLFVNANLNFGSKNNRKIKGLIIGKNLLIGLDGNNYHICYYLDHKTGAFESLLTISLDNKNEKDNNLINQISNIIESTISYTSLYNIFKDNNDIDKNSLKKLQEFSQKEEQQKKQEEEEKQKKQKEKDLKELIKLLHISEDEIDNNELVKTTTFNENINNNNNTINGLSIDNKLFIGLQNNSYYIFLNDIDGKNHLFQNGSISTDSIHNNKALKFINNIIQNHSEKKTISYNSLKTIYNTTSDVASSTIYVSNISCENKLEKKQRLMLEKSALKELNIPFSKFIQQCKLDNNKIQINNHDNSITIDNKLIIQQTDINVCKIKLFDNNKIYNNIQTTELDNLKRFITNINNSNKIDYTFLKNSYQNNFKIKEKDKLLNELDELATIETKQKEQKEKQMKEDTDKLIKLLDIDENNNDYKKQFYPTYTDNLDNSSTNGLYINNMLFIGIDDDNCIVSYNNPKKGELSDIYCSNKKLENINLNNDKIIAEISCIIKNNKKINYKLLYDIFKGIHDDNKDCGIDLTSLDELKELSKQEEEEKKKKEEEEKQKKEEEEKKKKAEKIKEELDSEFDDLMQCDVLMNKYSLEQYKEDNVNTVNIDGKFIIQQMEKGKYKITLFCYNSTTVDSIDIVISLHEAKTFISAINTLDKHIMPYYQKLYETYNKLNDNDKNRELLQILEQLSEKEKKKQQETKYIDIDEQQKVPSININNTHNNNNANKDLKNIKDLEIVKLLGTGENQRDTQGEVIEKKEFLFGLFKYNSADIRSKLLKSLLEIECNRSITLSEYKDLITSDDDNNLDSNLKSAIININRKYNEFINNEEKSNNNISFLNFVIDYCKQYKNTNQMNTVNSVDSATPQSNIRYDSQRKHKLLQRICLFIKNYETLRGYERNIKNIIIPSPEKVNSSLFSLCSGRDSYETANTSMQNNIQSWVNMINNNNDVKIADIKDRQK